MFRMASAAIADDCKIKSNGGLMFMKNNMKKEEIDYVTARILSKVNSTKKSSKTDENNSTFSDVQTGHCTPHTEHLQKEIGPGGLKCLGSRVFSLGFAVVSLVVFGSGF
jgi:hypothetical protein